MKKNIAIVGVTGLVGQKMIEVLAEKKMDANYYFYASGRSAGKTILFLGRRKKVLELSEDSIKGKEIDYALFAIDGELSKKFAPLFAEIGATIIDNSSAFRMDKGIPLIVPEINFDAIKPHHKIIANPNCSTIQAVVALGPLHKKYKIKRIIYSTYQAVSGAGQAGMDDLKTGSANKFAHTICNNILPHIDTFEADGYTKEEHKIINETRKILKSDKIKISATTVRVPITNCHSESIFVQFKKKCSVEGAVQILRGSLGVVVLDDVKNNIYPMPIVADNKDEVFVGRIRKDKTVSSGLNLWVVADNLRKGAASNAVQIMQRLIETRE
ncbi:MAG: aspartate-semialdehyde dehydrogenase [Christensenellaceae bacterium]|jgi:aspartate-semialdehyde dehydrogenase|nr:aspartate-semialdehyde dehydrogenase [Christensenellaceae bacterium]